MFNRNDFLTLAGSFNVFRLHMDNEATAVEKFQKNRMANTRVGVKSLHI